jgi:hypothetical protein
MDNRTENPASSPSTGPTTGTSSSTAKARKIILLHSEERKLLFRLDKQRVVIGSVESADVRLSGDGIAPIHAVIELGFDAAKNTYNPAIYDLASEMGVFVNDKKQISSGLKSGDSITIGKTKLDFELQDFAAMSSPPRSSTMVEGRRLFMNPDEDLKPLLLEESSGSESIFDYRPASKTALEVVMSWHGIILDVEHFVNKKTITLGTSKDADFGIPTHSPKFALVSMVGTEYVLNLDSQMKGVIQRKQELSPIDELRKTVTSQSVALHKDDFAKLQFGEIDFYLSFTSAPPGLKPQRLVDRDPFFFKIFFTSIALMGLLVGGLMQVKVSDQLETEQVPDRIATILYQPEKYAYHQDQSKIVEAPPEPQVTPKTQPTPQATVKLDIHPNAANQNKPVPKEMNVTGAKSIHKGSASSKAANGASHAQNQAKEGEGARAKGVEGKRGSTKATHGQSSQTKANRPSPNGGTGAGSGHSQVPDMGNVDVLKGATDKIENILGNSAAELGKGGEKIKGFGGFDTLGNGGLALEGSGKGGGGDANTTLGGLSNKGRGGGRVGTGLGAAGTGNGIVGGQSRMVIRTGGPEEAVVMGSIDADAVERALLAHKDEFRLCYEREINAENPNFAGRVGTNFVIGSSGRVTQAGIESSTLNNANTERCIIQVLKRIDFPIPRGAGVVQVTYPFKFTPVGK